PTCRSSATIARLTAGADKPSWRAAGAKPLASATATKIRMVSSRSIAAFHAVQQSNVNRGRSTFFGPSLRCRPHPSTFAKETTMTRPAQAIRIYSYFLSCHDHRVELFLSMLGLSFDRLVVAIDEIGV